MAAIGDWVKVLIVVVLLGNLVDFILPKGDLKRYGGLVVGLVILATIVRPLWGWMHQLNGQVAVPPASWTNTPSGFNQVVEVEEMHQAEAIVLSMPGVQACRLTAEPGGVVDARVVTASGVSAMRVRHYVKAALEVTLGRNPTIRLHVVHDGGN